jgi:hypothetical protein
MSSSTKLLGSPVRKVVRKSNCSLLFTVAARPVLHAELLVAGMIVGRQR